MPKIAYADQIHDLERLAEAVDLHSAELPTTGPRADHYRVLVQRVKELKALQQSCLAGYRTATRELEAAIREARYGAISLRAALTADFGPADARLVEFGIRLRRRRRRASRAGKVAVADGGATAAAEIPVVDDGPGVTEVAIRVAEPPRGSGAPDLSVTAAEKAGACLALEAAGAKRGRDARGQESVEGPGGRGALPPAAAEGRSRDTDASGGCEAPGATWTMETEARGALSTAGTDGPMPTTGPSRGPLPLEGG